MPKKNQHISLCSHSSKLSFHSVVPLFLLKIFFFLLSLLLWVRHTHSQDSIPWLGPDFGIYLHFQPRSWVHTNLVRTWVDPYVGLPLRASHFTLCHCPALKTFSFGCNTLLFCKEQLCSLSPFPHLLFLMQFGCQILSRSCLSQSQWLVLHPHLTHFSPSPSLLRLFICPHNTILLFHLSVI